ncbi:MAG: phosphoglucosamine mutase [Methanomassiliicoccales archaeon]
MSLFGSSGIRGIIGQDVTPELAISIGAAVGSMFDKILLAKDTRSSGDMVSSALSAGIMSTGCDVAYAGTLPTPTLARAAKAYDAGLMVTASHNPPEYNGVKMWNPDGSAFGNEQMRNVEELIKAREQRLVSWEQVGRIGTHSGAIEDHIESILDSVGASESSLVVIDCGNGATCSVSPLLFRRMGCSVVGLNCQEDGFFPGRPSEPSEENLEDLRHLVVKKGAKLGIAHDGDGDRMVAFDERGRFVDGDRLLALFTILTEAKEVVAPVDASMVLDDLVKKRVIRTRVGDVYVSEVLKTTGAEFGGEPSGTFIFPKQTFCPDGIYAAAFLLSRLEKAQLSQLIDSIPLYPVIRKSFAFPPARRSEIEMKIRQAIASLPFQEMLELDGYRAQFEEGWVLVRISGTEPKVRMTVEAKKKENLKKLGMMAEETIRRCLA